MWSFKIKERMTQQEFTNRYQFNIKNDKIGGGSFGTVYKAYDTILDIEVAIKISEVKFVGDKEFSLLEEFKAIENVPVNKYIANYDEVYRFESFNGIYDYGLMQFYPLGNLSHYLKKNPVNLDKRESLVLSILEGIAFLHKYKVVHRDLKPSNILVVDRKGELIPKITDFGLSKQASEDAKASRFTNSFAGGTLQYSSPEQLKGLPLKLNTDLWSFGVIAYEILTDNTLFETDTQGAASAEWQNAITQKILHQDVTQQLNKLPIKWQNTIQACLERDLNLRVQTADALFVLLNVDNAQQKSEETYSNTSISDETLIEEISLNSTIENETLIEEKLTSKTSAPDTKIGDETPPNTSSLQKKKNRISYILIGIIIISGLWYLKPNQEIIDPSVLEEYQLLKEEADSAYYVGVYELSLKRYNAAFNLMTNQSNKDADAWLEKYGIQDSINSLTTLIKSVEENNWDQAVKLNTILSYEEYISGFPEGKYFDEANKRIEIIRNKIIQEAVISKPKSSLEALASITKIVENKDDQRNELLEFFRLQADLTLHKLAYSLFRYGVDGGEYKFEEQVLAIANNLDNTNQDFITAREQFRKEPFSRYYLAKLMPFLVDELNSQIYESNPSLKESYSLNSVDLKLLSILGGAELVFDSGKHDSRYVSNRNSMQSVFNFTLMINEAVNDPNRSGKGETKEYIANRLKDINSEIVNFLDTSKIKDEAPKFYRNNRIKNNSSAYIDSDFTWVLIESGNQAEGFYRYRYLKNGDINLILNQTSPLVKVKK